MRSVLNVLLVLATLLPALALVSAPAQAQALKIGFINDEQIKESYPEWARAEEQLQLEMKAWEDEAVAKQTELQEMVEEYDKQKLILSDDKKREREATINAKRDALDAFTRQVFGPNGQAEQEQGNLMIPLLNKVNEAIRVVAEENGYDVIFTLQSALGYIKPSYDVTDKVLEQLEKLED